jgi:hypothetical protein
LYNVQSVYAENNRLGSFDARCIGYRIDAVRDMAF